MQMTCHEPRAAAVPLRRAALAPAPESDAVRLRAGGPVAATVDFIETHFAEPLSVAQLAEMAALSVPRFAALFRQQVGRSPYRYVCDVRIRHAKRMLLAGMPSSLVATEVGFFDQSHFTRHFKRICGTTPAMYLKARRAALQR